MQNHPNVFSSLNSVVWAIHPDKFDEISGFVNGLTPKDLLDHYNANADRVAAARIAAMEAEDTVDALYARTGISITSKGVAVVPMAGTMMKRGNMFAQMSGGTSTEMLTNAAKALKADGRVKGVVFRVDSPGGSVEGLSALSDAIRDLDVPTHAVADDMMASAAYFTASAADKVSATEDAIVGSIGTVASRWDYSEAYKDAGVKQRVWRSGPFKALGYPSEPVTENESKAVQETVDAYFNQFVDRVALHRNMTRNEALAIADGRTYVGKQALENNMIDSITSVDAAIAAMEADLDAESRFVALEDSFRNSEAEYTASIEEKEAEIARLQGLLDATNNAVAEDRADRFLASLVEQGKVAPMADHGDLRSNLVANFESYSKVFDLVPVGSAGPGTFDAAGAAPVEGDESFLDRVKAEAAEKGIERIALDADAATVFEEFGHVEGKGYLKGYAE